MPPLTDEDAADAIIDADLLGDDESARRHGTSYRQIHRMRDSLARGEPVPGHRDVDARFVRDRLKQRIRDSQLAAQLALAEALQREAQGDRPDPQRTMALASASKTYAEIEAANEDLDAHLSMLEEARRSRTLLARDTTAEPPQLEEGEAETESEETS